MEVTLFARAGLRPWVIGTLDCRRILRTRLMTELGRRPKVEA
jgi:hypothetical protein